MLMRDDFSGGFASPVTKPLHGLLLIRTLGHAGVYYVFNPCTRAVLALPDTKISWKISCKYMGYLTGRARPPAYKNVPYGLGYCSATGEYKVVRLFSDPDDGGCLAATRCEVFVLDAPACWRPTAQQLPPEFAVEVHSPAVFLNGLLYFLCSDSFDVITLDVGDETFGSAPPLPFAKEAAGDVSLTELDGCLCAYYTEYYRFVCKVAHVWRLRDHDDEAAARWEQLCRVDMAAWPKADWLSLDVDPLTIHDGGGGGEKKIIFRTGACRVFAMDLGCAGATPEILLKPERSLVPVGRTVEEAVFSSPANRAWSDVLKWLPARSVLELSLVCRAWRAMVTMKRFIRSHAVHANMIAKHPRIKLVMDFAAGEFADLDDLIISGNRPKMGTCTPFICSPPCHGLNLRSYGSSHFVFNPYEKDEICAPAGTVALGYDAATGRHVVLHILFRWRDFETRSYDLRCMAMHARR
uniref:F-box domain-containing protein n=1 Tax=Oryza punctata TaxID=4537 RepID=A0A0E0M8X3_ORYPU